MPDILSVCKAEEEGDAVDTPADDNAVDGKTGGTESAVTDRMEYWQSHVRIWQLSSEKAFFSNDLLLKSLNGPYTPETK